MNTYVILREDTNLPKLEEGYTPILVDAGHKAADVKEKYLCDDTLDHISNLYDSYSDLTALYWLWKNDDSDMVGLVYNDQFFFQNENLRKIGQDYFLKKADTAEQIHMLTEEEVNKLLKNEDMIVNYSALSHLTLDLVIKDTIPEKLMNELKIAMFELDPINAVYIETYLTKRQYAQHNMFIGRKRVIDNYCEWLFPLLALMDQKHEKETGERYHNGELGHIGEFLFGFWLFRKRIRDKKGDVVMPGESDIKTIAGFSYEKGSNIYPADAYLSHVMKAGKSVVVHIGDWTKAQ